MNFRIAIFFLLFRLSPGGRDRRQIVFVDRGECLTPDGLNGRCSSLSECPRSSGWRNLEFLRRSTCGFEGILPRLCCSHRMEFEVCGIKTKFRYETFGIRNSQLDAWPWLATVYNTKYSRIRGFYCGGALVSDRHVITSAHCVMERLRKIANASSLTVRLGEHRLNDDSDGANPVEFRVREVKSHPDFMRKTFKNNIAILVLEETVTFDEFVRPICLPYDQLRNEVLAGRDAFVAGWVTTAFDIDSNPELKELRNTIWNNEECRRVFHRDLPITVEYICAGIRDCCKESCSINAGGPLALPVRKSFSGSSRFYLVGVASFGKRIGTSEYPVVYTRVTEYLDWISNNLP
ncbi:proclotting enzyme-like [Centruroides sculpturatus]|uniref:proclotting enzyme-like n=1 Tax=Centruroides sculpturatus TaxID=218467 RepID=UPI000C6C97AC|nr:proclotting enzyme-like [Centruroides sculpturatus]